MPEISRISFQDPDGFVFTFDKKFYRLVLSTYSEDLKIIKDLGVLNSNYLVKHTEIELNEFPDSVQSWIQQQIKLETFLTIFELDKLEFISYPWEWTIGMLQTAAEFTLNFQIELLEKGLLLKDACFYNVQFINGKPVFIDLLSIKIAKNDIYPWFAYGQFLQQFIFPLVVVKHRKLESLQFLQAFPNGISKAEVRNYTSWRSHFSTFELFHIHFFNRLNKEEKKTAQISNVPTDRQKVQLKQLLQFAAGYVKRAYKPKKQTDPEWLNYYEKDTLEDYTSQKEKIIATFMEQSGQIGRAVDIGANTGLYSEMLYKYATHVLSVEMDGLCCDIILQKIASQQVPHKQWQIICSNMLYPSPAIGWLNQERKSLIDRAKSPFVIALAVIHHFYFSGSIGFDQIAGLLDAICTKIVVVEFIDKTDQKVMLLSNRNDTRLSIYTIENFQLALSHFFRLIKIEKVSDTRTLFFMEKNDI